MSVNEFVTSANKNYSLYITREEVIQGISSIIPALSTFSTISFGVTPNPKFSTITMPASGIIQGYAPIQTSNVVFASTSAVVGGATQLALGTIGGATNNNALCVADVNGNTGFFRAQRLIANTAGINGYGAGWSFNNTGFYLISGTDTQTPVLTSPVGDPTRIALQNVSTINGAPVGQGITTYTNLTGQNITNTGVVNTPSIVALSSLNGVPLSSYANSQLWVPYTVTVTSPVNVTMAAGVPQVVLTFTGLPITAAIGKYVNISVPINVSPSSGSVGAQTNVQLLAYMGGNVTPINTAVAGTCSLSPGSANGVRTVTLSGICSVNGPSATLQIQAVCDQNVVLTFQQGSYYTKFFFQQII